MNLYKVENDLRREGLRLVCGVDEAGRGPLAGPVCAAAVILPEGTEIPGLNDSKKLTEKKREALFPVIKSTALHWGIAFADHKEIDELDANGVRIRIIGDKTAFEGKLKQILETAEGRTANNNGLCFNIALNYGSRAEIVHAVNSLIESGAKSGEVTEEMLDRRLYTSGLPELDLIVRTAGEQRLSNFLLWQCAYAEFVFTSTLFPDLSPEIYTECLREYAGRTRRFGKVL